MKTILKALKQCTLKKLLKLIFIDFIFFTTTYIFLSVVNYFTSDTETLIEFFYSSPLMIMMMIIIFFIYLLMINFIYSYLKTFTIDILAEKNIFKRNIKDIAKLTSANYIIFLTIFISGIILVTIGNTVILVMIEDKYTMLVSKIISVTVFTLVILGWFFLMNFCSFASQKKHTILHPIRESMKIFFHNLGKIFYLIIAAAIYLAVSIVIFMPLVFLFRNINSVDPGLLISIYDVISIIYSAIILLILLAYSKIYLYFIYSLKR
jgi:hypothetical protein